MDTDSETVALLREIRDQQRLQIERQSESMALQREQVAMVRQQFERAERLQQRAESLQGKAARSVRLILWVALPLVIALVALLLWGSAESLMHMHRW